MKISFILYVFQVFGKNQYLTSHGIMYVFDDFLNFLNLTFIGIMYVFADFREKIFFTLYKIPFTLSLHYAKVTLAALDPTEVGAFVPICILPI